MPDIESLKKVAHELAEMIRAPLLLLISGELGAGKTTLVSQILQCWGIAGAQSPTFNLRNDYAAQGFRILHLDFYRLKPNDNAWDILPPDEDYSDAVVFAEWPEKAPAAIFAPFTHVARFNISLAPDGVRHMTCEGIP